MSEHDFKHFQLFPDLNSGDAVFEIKFFVKWANERREEDLQDPDVDEDDLWEVET